MIVVHPGSLCGSYHTSPTFDQDNLNKHIAEIEGWKGGKVLIENETIEQEEYEKLVADVMPASKRKHLEELPIEKIKEVPAR